MVARKWHGASGGQSGARIKRTTHQPAARARGGLQGQDRLLVPAPDDRRLVADPVPAQLVDVLRCRAECRRVKDRVFLADGSLNVAMAVG